MPCLAERKSSCNDFAIDILRKTSPPIPPVFVTGRQLENYGKELMLSGEGSVIKKKDKIQAINVRLTCASVFVVLCQELETQREFGANPVK